MNISLQGIEVLNTIQKLDRQMDVYEAPELLDQAMELIPLQELHDRAERTQSSTTPLACFEDALAGALVEWFKNDFFVWADRKTGTCPVCGDGGGGSMQYCDYVEPTEEERSGGATRVELYVCEKGDCDGVIRFARYNDPAVLMRTRVGRCGEFANLFTLFLRAMGFRAQYVWNREDHVWNSYFSPALNRWVHLDPCEGARDQPLLYSKGWGKAMSYCLAFSTDGAVDVSRGYIQTEKWEESMKMRNLLSEAELEKALGVVTGRRRMGLPPDVIRRLEREDGEMREWLRAPQDGEAGAWGDELKARQTGGEEWKEARGEAGVAA